MVSTPKSVLTTFNGTEQGHGQVGNNTHFREINISAKTPEFVISLGNLGICIVNDNIFKNVINIHPDSQYPLWLVNGEPSNTIGTFELLFPISKKVRSCFVPKKIILVTFQKASF